MKRVIICMFVALLATVSVQAQQIAVVSGDGTTTMCQTLKDAIEGSSDGSTIYLPGGGFQIGDTVKISKEVHIIGIGHKPISENADGNTVIGGSLQFEQGSSGSTVMGCYISGDVKIGLDGKSVDNIQILHCNLSSVQVGSANCSGTLVNQNYIRNCSNFRSASALFTNNIAHSILNLDGNRIEYNIITNHTQLPGNAYNSSYHFPDCGNCTISRNILLTSYAGCGSSCIVQGNMSIYGWSLDSDIIKLSDVTWSDVFEKYNDGKITPASDFHFKDAYKEYENQVGIYAGTGFTDSGMAPVPFIEAKDIPDKTDAEGKLNIKIRVKASE